LPPKPDSIPLFRFTISQLHANQSLVIGEYTDERLSLTDDESSILVSSDSTAYYPAACLECRCTNLPVIAMNIHEASESVVMRWRSETWLTVILTVAAVGTAVSIAFAGYISCKSCSEVIEGSQVRK
jgi:hypothetical protein